MSQIVAWEILSLSHVSELTSHFASIFWVIFCEIFFASDPRVRRTTLGTFGSQKLLKVTQKIFRKNRKLVRHRSLAKSYD